MSARLIIPLVLALAVVLTGLGVWAYLRVRARKLRKPVARRGLRLKHPVVLAHGIMGFDKLTLASANAAYFRGIEPRLTKLGAQVYAFKVRPSASITSRAEDLVKAINELDARKVNIIAHSMGGLDARYAVARLGLQKRVASIVTIGTPHRGTPLADLGTGLWGLAPAAKKMLEAMGIDISGFFDLTTERMQRFNADVLDVRGVFYGSWLAQSTGGLTSINPLLLPTWKLIRDRAGENDGLVPLESQQWGERLGEIEADHWAQIGWSHAFDAPAFYESAVRELMARGL